MAFKRILAPVDYSEPSKHALMYAADLAQTFAAELDIVHVWDRPAYVSEAIMVGRPGDEQRSLADLIHENAQKDMAEFLSTVSLPPTVRASHRLLSGEPASTLLEELKKGQHDLIVLGTHGRTGLSHFIMGSVAEKLVRMSPIAVLTVPAGVGLKPIFSSEG